MQYEIIRADNGKYQIVNLTTGEVSPPRFRTLEYAQQVANQLRAEDARLDAYEEEHGGNNGHV